MCQNLRHGFLRSMCEETDAMLTLFSAGVYLDLWVREALQTYSHFRHTVIFAVLNRSGHNL